MWELGPMIGSMGWTLCAGVAGYAGISFLVYGGDQTWEDLRRGTYIEGLTGAGKTTLISDMAANARKTHHAGIVMIDVADSCRRLLDILPEGEKVVYVAPWRKDCTIGFNALHRETFGEAERNGITGRTLETCRKLFTSSWGDAIDHILRFSLLGLLQGTEKDREQVTLKDLRRFISNAQYRDSILSKVEDEIVKERLDTFEWGTSATKGTTDSADRKLCDLLSNSWVTKLFSNPNGKSIGELLDSGHIVLFDFDTAKMDIWSSSFCAALALTTLQTAVYGRKSRDPIFLTMDEFHRYATDSIEELLSQARKYNVSTVLAHQSGSGQLTGILKSAVHLASNTIFFRLMVEDAGYAAQRCGYRTSQSVNRSINDFVQGLVGSEKVDPKEEKWEAEDFVSLPLFTVIERLTVRNKIQPARRRELKMPEPMGNRNKLIQASFKEFGIKEKPVDEGIFEE